MRRSNPGNYSSSIHLCEEIDNNGRRSDCYDSIIDIYSSEKNYLEFCNTIPLLDKKDYCLSIAVIHSNNITLCLDISDKKLASDCMVTLGICNNNSISAKGMLGCFDNSIEEGNHEICSAIESYDLHNECKEFTEKKVEDLEYCKATGFRVHEFTKGGDCLTQLALSTLDITICNEIEDLSDRSFCEGILVARIWNTYE